MELTKIEKKLFKTALYFKKRVQLLTKALGEFDPSAIAAWDKYFVCVEMLEAIELMEKFEEWSENEIAKNNN